MRSAAVIALLIALISMGEACKVPVFRYALERWESDAYRAVILYRGADLKSSVEVLAAPLVNAPANLEVELINVADLTEEQKWQIDDVDVVGKIPQLRLHYPHGSNIEAPLWEGPLDTTSVSRVIDSPIRTQLVDAILKGSSTTWILLQCGDASRDAAAETRLRALLDTVTANLTIPEGVVRADEVTAEGTTKDGQPLEMDDVLRTEIPLKIHFPIFTLSRETPAESIFIKMLEHFGGKPDEPVAIPVFGRGRALEGIPASALSKASISGACDYLCGECSCQVKDENPGLDLLLAVDWNAKLEGTSFIVERALPALSGFGVAEPSASQKASSSAESHSPLPKVLVLTLGGILAVTLLGTYLIARR